MTLRYLLNAILSLTVLLALAGCGENGGDHKGENPAAHRGEEKHGQEEENHEVHAEESGHGEGEREVHLSEEQAALLSIEVDQAPGGTAEANISAPATVAFDPDRTARVGPRLSAKVVEVLVDLGAQVRAGQPLALMDSVELGRAKAGYLSAQGKLESARADWEREQSLAEQQITSEAELLDAKAAFQAARGEYRSALETLKLYGLSREQIDDIDSESQEGPLSRFTLAAPAAGVVQRRNLAPGQTLSASETPIHIVDTRQMWLLIDAFEKSLPHLTPGQLVNFRTRALPNQTFAGKTDWISRELDPESRTLTVRAVLDNPDGRLRAGMAGTANIQTEGTANYALVPVDAVQRLGEEEVVFVPGVEAGAYEPLPVTLGDEGNGWIEIRDGIEPGDRVVVRGAFDLMSALTASSRSAAHSH
jgi:cobalt-zinc-cadmium efflux system membrane fusion protein